jgi:hypothetical protein
LENADGRSVTRVLGYVASFMVVGALVYAVINWVLAESLGLKGGVPVMDIETSLVVGLIGILLLAVLTVYQRISQGNGEPTNADNRQPR